MPSPESTPRLRDADEQRVRESTLRSLQADPEGYLSRYAEQFANVLNADDAATLFDEYQADPARYRVAVHPAAVWIRDELFRRALTGDGSRLVFTAGSNAAGKSTAIRGTRTAQDSVAVMDTTLSNTAHARELLGSMLATGKQAQVLYIRRNLADAFAGMLKRARREGRVVSIGQMIHSDAGAAEVVRHLAADFAGDPRVQIRYIDNSGKTPHEAGIELARPQDYTETRSQLHELADKALQSGQISAADHERITGRQGIRRPDGE